MLFGVNPIANILKDILKLDTEGGYPTGRFRDIYLKDDKIILYTRNGGGNRDCWEKGKTDCDCPGCVIVNILPKHPNYIKDYDDDFDSTYAYIEFTIPDEHKEEVEELRKFNVDNRSISDKFKKLC